MAELRAVKGNKQLRIVDAEKDDYLAMGYDIAEVVGDRLKVIEMSPTKTVPYGKYRQALEKISTYEVQVNLLNKQVKALESQLVKAKKEGGK